MAAEASRESFHHKTSWRRKLASSVSSFYGLRREVLGFSSLKRFDSHRVITSSERPSKKVSASLSGNGSAPKAFDYDLVIIGASVGGHGDVLHAVEKWLKQSDAAVVLDHGTDIFIWLGAELAAQERRSVAALAACRTLAEELTELRFPAPRILAFKEGSSQARYFVSRLIPAHKDPPYEQGSSEIDQLGKNLSSFWDPKTCTVAGHGFPAGLFP